jgi:hypothetical protein
VAFDFAFDLYGNALKEGCREVFYLSSMKKTKRVSPYQYSWDISSMAVGS